MKNYIVQLKQLELTSKYDLINKIIILMLIPHTIFGVVYSCLKSYIKLII